MKTEPLITIGAISASIGAIIALLAAFNVNITDQQTQAILSAVTIIGPIITVIVGRNFVWSPTSKDKAVNQAETSGYIAGREDAGAAVPVIVAPDQAA